MELRLCSYYDDIFHPFIDTLTQRHSIQFTIEIHEEQVILVGLVKAQGLGRPGMTGMVLLLCPLLGLFLIFGLVD